LFEAGRLLTGPRNCGVCHLTDFRGRNQIPRLTGQREDFLARTMAEYRDGTRIGTDTNMNAVMVGVTDAQIAALAHYLSQRD
jgi:cytochrome c553